MKTKFAFISAVLAAALAVCSCAKTEPSVYNGPFDSVTLFYAAAYNNLSDGITSTAPTSPEYYSDLQDLCSGQIPGKKDKHALLAYCHSTYYSYDYTTPNNPVLIRIYKEDDKPVLDTIKVYPTSMVSASPSTVANVLNTLKQDFKSDHYGFVFSSHGTGWMPNNYYGSNKPAPAPNSVGAQYDKTFDYSYEMDLKEFADAIPFHLDYIVFDACLMGGVEVAYELKDKCSRIVFSPTEIFTEGMYYKDLAMRLCNTDPDLVNVCKDYMANYSSGATITLVDCSKLDALAAAAKPLAQKYQSDLLSVNASKVQRLYTGNHPWFYDMRDIFAQVVASEAELAELDKAIKAALPYTNYTPEFGKGTAHYIKIDKYCGLSMYLPRTDGTSLKTYYKTLAWDKATGLLK